MKHAQPSLYFCSRCEELRKEGRPLPNVAPAAPDLLTPPYELELPVGAKVELRGREVET